MTIVITAFERSPDGGLGLARDTRVRWALEEVGLPYEVRFVSLRSKFEPAHLRLHPFGLIPTYEEGDLVLFETGAIILHIAEHHAGLFPADANARARAITWMFAARQHRRAADPRARHRQDLRRRQALGRRASAAGQGPGPRTLPSSSLPAWAMPTGSMAGSARAT